MPLVPFIIRLFSKKPAPKPVEPTFEPTKEEVKRHAKAKKAAGRGLNKKESLALVDRLQRGYHSDTEHDHLDRNPSPLTKKKKKSSR